MAQATDSSSIALSVHEAAAAVIDLINATPRTPWQEEIAEIIGRIAEPAAVEPAQWPPMPADCGFEAIPITFSWTNTEFANEHLPWVRTGLALMWRDLEGVKTFIRTLLADDDEAEHERLLNEFDGYLGDVAQRFSALADMLHCAQARVMVARAQSGAAPAMVQPVPRATMSGFALASPLTLELRRVRRERFAAILAELNADEKTPAYAAACETTGRLEGEFEALCEQAWARPVKSWDDLVQRVEIALAYCDQTEDGQLVGLWAECKFERSEAHLLAAAAAIAGCPIVGCPPAGREATP